MNALVRYDEACRALSAAVTVDEAKDIRDKSDALRIYARQAKNKQLECDAAEIRFRAERRIGELMAAQRDAGLMNGGAATRVAEKPALSPTLADAGIDKNLADRSRKLAAIPTIEFEEILENWHGKVEEENSRVVINILDFQQGFVHVSNNSGNNEWYTPVEFIEAARLVLGQIDLDPASSEIANKTVCASKFFTIEDDALSQEWPVGSIWMNPPYAQPLMGQFASKYAEAIQGGSEGIILVNNATETTWFQEIASVCSAICFPKSRIKFLDPQGNATGAPLQGQALIYSGNTRQVFYEAFSQFGLVVLIG